MASGWGGDAALAIIEWAIEVAGVVGDSNGDSMLRDDDTERIVDDAALPCVSLGVGGGGTAGGGDKGGSFAGGKRELSDMPRSGRAPGDGDRVSCAWRSRKM